MIGVIGVNGLEDAKIVGMLRGMGEEFAHRESALALARVGERSVKKPSSGSFCAKIRPFGALPFISLQGGFRI